MKAKFHRVGKTLIVPAIVIRQSTIPSRYIVEHLPSGKKRKVCGMDQAKELAETWVASLMQ